MFKTEEDATYKPAKKACIQLVDNLVEHILKYEESLAGVFLCLPRKKGVLYYYNMSMCCLASYQRYGGLLSDSGAVHAPVESKGVNSTRQVACITTLYLFSKIRAQLMVKHAMTMQPYLTTKCNVSSRTHECVKPTVVNVTPPEMFQYMTWSDCLKLLQVSSQSSVVCI